MTDEIRSSQILTTYGPGCMVDFPDKSVIIGGLEGWEYDNANIPQVDEPRLVQSLRRILNVADLSLRQPPPMSSDFTQHRIGITAYRFPEWFLVQKTERSSAGHTRRKLVHLNNLENGKYRDDDRERQSVVPIRFVRACINGHVGDINWKVFVHEDRNSTCLRTLWVEERGTSGDLNEVWIKCDCGKERPMSQAARRDKDTLGRCDGSRPWLGPDSKEKCSEYNRLLIRSASNAYFPQIMSVISIPDPRGPVDEIVEKLWDNFFADVETMADLQKCRKKPAVRDALQGVSDDKVMAAIQRRLDGGGDEERKVKQVEFEALTETAEELGSDVPDGDYYARKLPHNVWQCDWMSAVRDVVLVHRLREVIALVGFTRFEAAGPDIDGELQMNVQRASIVDDAEWLPAVENKGEGVFIQFDTNAIEEWMARDAVKDRQSLLVEGLNKWKDEHKVEREFPGTAYYMLHSLSHLLLTSISLECGYPASSLKERIYARRGQYGILIFTGTPGAEGTLGGLVEAGRDIKRHFWNALEMGALCSNDPVCAMREPGRNSQIPLSGCACHGCLLIAETSCEQRNDFLDRALVVPTVENSDTAFFPSVGL